MPDQQPIQLSIIVTVLNEADNVTPVCQEIVACLKDLPSTEVIFVNDGSTDLTLQTLKTFKEKSFPHLRILSHDRRLGKSAALRTGIEAAQGTWIATMDGDGQDNPQEIVRMFSSLSSPERQKVLIVGVRKKRSDTLSRKIATRLANCLRQFLLKDRCPDTGAPLKIFRKTDFLRLPQFEGIHRFLPALFQKYGVPLICIPVKHRNRLHGQSKYTNLNRALVGIRDLLGVIWLRQRTHLPKEISES